jgi:F-type H+-transporting ATPase subunit epsilon
MSLQVEMVSPEGIKYTGDADMVIARTLGGGDIAFLPGHAPFLGALDTWTLEIRLADGSDRLAAVHGGFVEVRDDHVTILSDIAELDDQIDIERAKRAAAAADEAIRASDDAVAEASLRRAHARLRAAGQDV